MTPAIGPPRAASRFALFSLAAVRVACVPAAIAMLVTVWLSAANRLLVTGDEPHYLVMADGLVHDRTFDLRAAYAREGQSQRIYGSPLPAPHVLIVNHRWGPYHEPGLPLALAVPFALGGVTASRIALCVFAGLLPLACFMWLRERTPAAEWLAIGIAIGVPISFGASQIYPDLAAGIMALGLFLWLLDGLPGATPARWAAFWLIAGLLPWLNLKFLPTTAALTFAVVLVLCDRDRRERLRPVVMTSALVLVGPVSLAGFHLWAFETVFGPRGAAELTSSASRAAMMFLGLHLDQAQGIFLQQPLLLAGVAALLPFARRHPRVALAWAAVYASLIVPNSMELARFGGGGPAGRFAWSAAWLWIVPVGYALEERGPAWSRCATFAVIACLAYQALLATRWLADPHVLFPTLDESLALRNSLFPTAMRAWLPSFYFWDFSSYWTYGPNVAAYLGIGGLALIGELVYQAERRA